MITEDTEVTNTLNVYFETAVNTIGILQINIFNRNWYSNLENPIKLSIKKFENHPSILSIIENFNVEQSFQFSEITEEVLSEINNLDIKKVESYKNITTKILRETSEISSKHLVKIWNEQVIRSKNFPYEFKVADITSVFKKEDSTLAKTIHQ